MQEFYNIDSQAKSFANNFTKSALDQLTRNWNIEKDHVWWGKGWNQIFGYQQNNPLFISSWRDNIHCDDLDRVMAFFNEALSNQHREFVITYRFKKSDGVFLQVRDTILISYQDSAAVHLAGFMEVINQPATEWLAEPDFVTSLALEVSGSGSFTLVLDKNEIVYSPNFSKILTGDNDTLVTRQIFINHLHPDDIHLRTKAYEQAEKSGVLSYEARFIWKDGSVHWIKVLAKYAHDASGKPVSITGIAMDISQQAQMNLAYKMAELAAEKKLRESEALFRNITDASTAALWITDENGLITYVSKAWIEWTGAPLEMHLGNGWQNFVASQDLEDLQKGFYEDFNKRVYHHNQFCIVHTDLTVRCVVCKGSPQYDDSRQFTGYIGAITDITELVQAQKELENSEKMMHSMIEQSPVAIGLFNTKELTITKVNPALLSIIEKNNSILGMKLPDAVPELDGQILIERFRHVYRSGEIYESYDTPVILEGKNGPVSRYFNIVCTPIKTTENQIGGIMVMASDFTWQHKAQFEVKASELRFRSLIENSPVACALYTGRELIIAFANEAMIKILGKGHSILGQKLEDALPELEGQPYLALLDQVYVTGVAYHSSNAITDLVVDGKLSTYYFDFSYTPLFDLDQNVYGILEMAVDITERVMALTSLQQSERRYRELADDLERSVQARTHELMILNKELQNSNQNLEQFAYVASHDLQEPLRKIVSFGSRLALNHTDHLGTDGKFMLSRMQEAAMRMSKMIDDLLSFSRLKANQKAFSSVDLDQLIRSVLSDLEISIQEKNAVIEINLPDNVWGDASQLSQLFLNLISNALKYQPSGQIPYIRIASFLVDPAEISSQTALIADHPYLKVTIQDNGIGFDQKHVQRIFQMFQRLHGKSEYAGSGIGLTLCRKVVQNHYGLLTAESEINKGACFTAYLPASVTI